MEIIKQTNTQLFFKVKSSKEALYIYWGVLIVVNIFVVVLCVIIYGLAAIWSLFFLFVLDLILLEGTITTYTVAIDKSKDTLEIRKNDRVIYTSGYSLQEIQCVKTVVGPNYWNEIISSLVIVLRDGNEEAVDTSTNFNRLPFYIDIHANTQARMGNKMAEFFGVPYQDSEYTHSTIAMV